MKKPSNWEELPRHELVALARKLNDWNAGQAISHAAHNKHYKEEIQPLYKKAEKMWWAFWDRIDNKK